VQVLAGLEIGVPALNRLDEDRGEFVPIAAEDLERLRTPVLQDQHVLNERW
jgi:hypothetical protein